MYRHSLHGDALMNTHQQGSTTPDQTLELDMPKGRQMRTTLVTALFVFGTAPLFFSACDGGDIDQGGRGIDEALNCPEGWVGWNFAEASKNTQEYIARTGSITQDGGAAAVVTPAAITVSAATCDNQPDKADLDAIQRVCAGQKQCTSNIVCKGNFVVTYGCGIGEATDAGVGRTFTANGSEGGVSLMCQPRKDDTVAARTESVCIPYACHGQSRRDENMQCIEDSTIKTVGHRTQYGALVVAPAPRTKIAHRTNTFWYKELINNGLYDFTTNIKYPSAADVPDNAQVTIWMVDQYADREWYSTRVTQRQRSG